MEVLDVICKRMCVELQEEASDIPMSDPLLWLVHGSPGTGKSEVLRLIKKLFLEVCGWQMGLDYQMVAIQAVMAQLWGGDTIHHACGINPFGASKSADASKRAAQRQAAVAERVLLWRWFYFDEISMVAAQLLAQVDMKMSSPFRREPDEESIVGRGFTFCRYEHGRCRRFLPTGSAQGWFFGVDPGGLHPEGMQVRPKAGCCTWAIQFLGRRQR